MFRTCGRSSPGGLPQGARPGAVCPGGTVSGSRWKAERSLASLLANRRLVIWYERRAGILTAFLHLGSALICARKLQPL